MARPKEAAREAVIAEHLKALKLPSFSREYQALARRAADGSWAYEDYLRELLEVELADREERTAERRLRGAKFPEVKTLEQIDWSVLKGVSKQKIMQLASCEYLSKAEDVVLAGPIGTGKTHIAIGLGVEAARRRFRVTFVRTSELVRSLIEARDERTLTR
ncbi:MAG: ATP-binding protein, partial [Actinobacteria bacterium]|nr:ATP-binding protein [Actinomycetota bacterium]